jgi:hypothetical protein
MMDEGRKQAHLQVRQPDLELVLFVRGVFLDISTSRLLLMIAGCVLFRIGLRACAMHDICGLTFEVKDDRC